MRPIRYSDCSVVGQTDKLESDIIVPDSRFKAEAESGGESNAGDVTTNWDIDEQDDMLASVMCSEWKDEELTSDEEDAGIEVKKTLELGTTRSEISLIKKYTQSPVEYQHFKHEQLNQLKIDMALKSFVKMTWSFMGANNPLSEVKDPIEEISGAEYVPALTTKSFKTLEGYMLIGDDFTTMTKDRQSGNFSLTINNNMEKTDGLFETEAIEQSLGVFDVSGSFDIWKSGEFARILSNEGIKGADKCLKVAVSREVGMKKYTYEMLMKIHLDNSSEAKDGNKLKNTITFSIGKADGLKFVKTIQNIA